MCTPLAYAPVPATMTPKELHHLLRRATYHCHLHSGRMAYPTWAKLRHAALIAIARYRPLTDDERTVLKYDGYGS